MINYDIVNKNFLPNKPMILGSQGDSFVETVIFKMDRYYNDIDLIDGSHFVHTSSKGGTRQTSPLELLSGEDTDDKLTFKWDVGFKHTKKDGNISFQITVQKDDNLLWASNLGTFIITKSIFNEFDFENIRTREKEPVIMVGREMHIPDDTKIIGVEKDNMSESITFLSDRYYDGIDLFNKKWYIEILNANNEYDIFGAKLEEESDKKIKIIWEVNSKHTKSHGEIKVKIRVTNYDEDNEDEKSYIWQSYYGIFIVADTFGEAEIIEHPNLGIVDELLKAAEDAKESATEAETALTRLTALDVSATGLPAESAPTVVRTETETGIALAFGIPEGQRGEKGEKGEPGQDGTPFTYEMLTPQQLASLKGDKGDKGNVMYAVFDINDDGDLTVTTPDGYTGPSFTLNDNGELEVTI